MAVSQWFSEVICSDGWAVHALVITLKFCRNDICLCFGIYDTIYK